MITKLQLLMLGSSVALMTACFYSIFPRETIGPLVLFVYGCCWIWSNPGIGFVTKYDILPNCYCQCEAEASRANPSSPKSIPNPLKHYENTIVIKTQ